MPVRGKNVSLLRNVRLVSGTQPVFKSPGTGDFSAKSKAAQATRWTFQKSPVKRPRQQFSWSYAVWVVLLCWCTAPGDRARVGSLMRSCGDCRLRSCEEVENLFVNGYEFKSSISVATEFLNSSQVHSCAAGLCSKLVQTRQTVRMNWTFKRQVKSHLSFARIIRSSPYSPR